MKKSLTKLLTLLGVFLFLGAGNAWGADDYWLLGDNNADWEPTAKKAAYKFSEDNGTYALIVTDFKPGNYKITGGSWDTTFGQGGNNKTLSLNTDYKAFRGKDSGNIEINYSGTAVIILKNIYWDNGYCYATVRLEELSTTDTYSWRLRGQFSSDESWSSIDFKKDGSSDIWETNAFEPNRATGSFGVSKIVKTKINNFYQCAWYSTNGTLNLNKSLTLTSNGGTNLKYDGLTWNNEYVWRWNASNNQISIVEPESKWYLSGMFTTTSTTDWPAILMTKVDGKDCLYTTTITPTQSTGKFLVRENESTYWKTKDGKTLTLNQQKEGEGRRFMNLNKPNAEGDDATFNLQTGVEYTVLWDADTKVFTIRPNSYPEKLYICGHINNSWWDPENIFELKETSEGVYENEFVEITGFWRERDVKLAPSKRTLYYPTNNENYIAFFDFVPEGFPEDDKTLYWGMKYAAYHVENNFADVFNNITNCQPKLINTDANGNKTYQASIVHEPQGDENNFVVPDGCYKVTVDLKNGTVTFEDGQVKERNYTWHYGSSTNTKDETAKASYIGTEEDGHAVHSFIEGKEAQNIIQVGVDKNLFHKAARQVRYQVWYKNTKSNKPGMRKVDALMSDDDLKQNYTEVTGNKEYYTTYGSDNYLENHMIELNKVGEYVVTASLKPAEENGQPIRGYIDSQSNNLIDDLANYIVNDSQAVISVNSSVVTGAFAESENDKTKPWSMNDNVFEDFLIIDNDDITKDDLVLTISRANPDTEGYWLTNNGSRPDNFDPYLWGQMIGIKNNNVKKYNVDGYWDESLLSSTLNGSNGTFSLEAHFPCSGVYNVSVALKSGTEAANNYTLNVSPTQVTIYPTILNVYPTISVDVDKDTDGNITNITPQYIDYASSYSIYGYYAAGRSTAGIGGVLENNSEAMDIVYGVTKYSEKELPKGVAAGTYVTNFWSLENATFYTPGVYLAQGTFNTSSSKASVKRNADNVEYTEKFYTLDISELENSDHSPATDNTLTVNVFLSKNGATTPTANDGKSSVEQFKVSISTTVPTIVEAIGAEDGEAVYYNLQGVKVENPEKGIYVKVQNGKATKVAL